ncbi:unnamed protein product [Durusdinium trenchii]|uniref:Uncharacterized protein n=1 Tax=Durusdinium trenchii TaxID=1381693 RepID=A0ABP0H8M6_9DINO
MGVCSSKSKGDPPPFVTKHEQYAKMWLMKVSDFLELQGTLPMHQELQKRGLLVEYQLNFLVIFVSHQWVGRAHPDRFGEQLSVLQGALKNIINGEVQVENDLMSQMMFKFRRLSPQERGALKDAYIWMDWYSIPQGGFAKSLHDEGNLTETAHEAWRCINSIPYYVDCSDIFVALVPPLQHNDTGLECNYRSWLSRGWCRTEMWMKLLSDKSDTPIVVVSSANKAEFISPVRWVHYPIENGEFSVEEDRKECCRIAQIALDIKLEKLERNAEKGENLNLYRYYLARYEAFCGLRARERSLDDFLSDFKFENIQAALKQKKGMGAIACAVASEDIGMLKAMAKAGAPLETRFPEIAEIDLWMGFTPMHLAALNSWHSEQPLLELLKLKGNVNANCAIGTSALGTCRNASAVQLMVEYGADVNFGKGPIYSSVISNLAGRGAEPEAIRKLVELKADVNPRGVSPWNNVAMLFQGNPHGLETAQTLVDLKADVNRPNDNFLFMAGLTYFCRAYEMCSKDPPAAVSVFANSTSSPLGSAAIFGQTELVEFLLQARADANQRNARGLSPLDLARNTHTREVLQQSFRASKQEGLFFDISIFKSEMVEERF